MLILLPLLGVFFNGLTTAHVEANLSLEFKATKLLRQHNPANCTVGNTTYAHGQTFKLDCKTQCVCENGRHACSSLCPKEQLPAPEDTLSCRSPRLVEVPGHCCKMWLCENPTADVYATCHNASTSPWTPCSQPCGLGISTRFTSTNAGCRQLSNLRLCENRKCDQDNNNNNSKINKNYAIPMEESQLAQKTTAIQQKQAHEQQQQQQKPQLISHNAAAAAASNLVVSEPKDIKDSTNYNALFEHEEHRIRKGHECRNLQRLGPARIRLGACISRKLYRPKLCGLCHQHSGKCCVPSVSTTIQVELLCPLNANDPISFAEQQQKPEGQSPLQLWDTVSLEPIDQEFLQSHQIQIENKFIAVEWILKCECNKKENCNNLHKYSATMQSNRGSNNSSNSYNSKLENNNNNQDSSWHTSGYVDDHNNNKNAATNIISTITHNYNKNAYNNANNANTTGSGNDKRNMANSIGKQDNEQNIADDNGSDNRYVQQQQQQEQQEIKEATEAEQEEQHLVSSSTSSELQPDIIPYPAMLPPRRNNRQQQQEEQNQKRPANGDKKNKNKGSSSNWRGGEQSSAVSSDGGDGMRTNIERDNNKNNNNKKGVKNVAVSNENIFIADFGFYGHDSDEGDHNGDVDHSTGDDEKAKYYGSNEQQQQQQNALEGKQGDQLEQQHSQVEEWQVEKNLHYGYREQQLAAPVFGRAWQQYYTQDEQQEQQQKQKQQQYKEQKHQQHHHHDHHTHLQHQQRYQHQHHQDHYHHHHHHHQHRHHQQHPHPPPPPPQPEHHFELEQQQESAITPHALPQRRT
ncbi:transcription factor mef2A-like [Rhagoletis pomonella]|uniref:transcription factor mef2A-like n=1 Tax=Rhagoletis pomonella TaxID=28610 RepID=UPI001785BD31|nr:transcription factor mef2A-like [Rhagoletis pomonella]